MWDRLPKPHHPHWFPVPVTDEGPNDVRSSIFFSYIHLFFLIIAVLAVCVPVMTSSVEVVAVIPNTPESFLDADQRGEMPRCQCTAPSQETGNFAQIKVTFFRACQDPAYATAGGKRVWKSLGELDKVVKAALADPNTSEFNAQFARNFLARINNWWSLANLHDFLCSNGVNTANNAIRQIKELPYFSSLAVNRASLSQQINSSVVPLETIYPSQFAFATRMPHIQTEISHPILSAPDLLKSPFPNGFFTDTTVIPLTEINAFKEEPITSVGNVNPMGACCFDPAISDAACETAMNSFREQSSENAITAPGCSISASKFGITKENMMQKIRCDPFLQSMQTSPADALRELEFYLDPPCDARMFNCQSNPTNLECVALKLAAAVLKEFNMDPGQTYDDLAKTMTIQSISTDVDWPAYFTRCNPQPSACTVSRQEKASASVVLAAILGTYGGITQLIAALMMFLQPYFIKLLVRRPEWFRWLPYDFKLKRFYPEGLPSQHKHNHHCPDSSRRSSSSLPATQNTTKRPVIPDDPQASPSGVGSGVGSGNEEIKPHNSDDEDAEASWGDLDLGCDTPVTEAANKPMNAQAPKRPMQRKMSIIDTMRQEAMSPVGSPTRSPRGVC